MLRGSKGVIRVRHILAVTALALLLPAPAAANHRGIETSHIHPVIFVHGFEGSGAQFESQAMRFEGNGYSNGYVRALDYDSTFSVESMSDVQARLDVLIADLKQQTGKSRVDIVGHSLGTSLMQSYLNSS